MKNINIADDRFRYRRVGERNKHHVFYDVLRGLFRCMCGDKNKECSTAYPNVESFDDSEVCTCAEHGVRITNWNEVGAWVSYEHLSVELERGLITASV